MTATENQAAASLYTISIANQKGGVGKTTTTVGLAESLTRLGHRTLVIDFDGQSNLTGWVFGRELKPDEVSIHDVLKSDEWTLAEAADRAESFGFDFVGASDALFDLDASFSDARFPQYVLQEAIDDLTSQNGPDGAYDFCLIDCPPALGLAVTMALCASDGVVVPTTLESMSIQGLGKLIQDVEEVRKRANPSLQLLGIVATMVDVRRKMTPELDAALRETYGETYLGDFRIRPRTTISEASALGTTIHGRSQAKGNRDFEFYDDLANELLTRIRSSRQQSEGLRAVS